MIEDLEKFGFPFCPCCGATGPIDPGDGLGCCINGMNIGYWSEEDGLYHFSVEPRSWPIYVKWPEGYLERIRESRD